MNVMLMSQDPVALDSVFCHLIHLKPEMVPTNYHGEKMGLGTWKEEEIEILTPNGPITMGKRLPSMAIHILMWTGEWHGPVCGSVSQRL